MVARGGWWARNHAHVHDEIGTNYYTAHSQLSAHTELDANGRLPKLQTHLVIIVNQS